MHKNSRIFEKREPEMIYGTRRVVTSSLAAVAIGSPFFAFAEDTFQAEAGLSYSRLKADLVRQNTVGVEATYFFDKLPALPKDYPLEQAQFVERIGSFSANYGRTSFQIDNAQNLSNGNGSMYGVTALFTRPDSPLIVSAGYESFYSGKYSTSLVSLPGSYETETDTRAYQAAIGAYVDKTTALSLDWSRSKTRAKFTSSSVTLSLSDFNVTSTSIGFSGQHLAQLSGGDYLAFIAGFSQDTHEQEGAASQKNRSYFLQAKYYPTKMLGLKVLISSDRGDDRLSEGETYEAGARMFFTPAISLSLDYQRFRAKEPNNNDNFITLKALMRF